MFDNVPKKFLPPQEDWPDFVYAHPEVNWVHYKENVNACSEILDVGIAKKGWGENVAIYDANKDESWTYLRLQEEVNRLGNALLKLGVQPGDRVMWRFGEVPEAAVAQLAIWKIGAINVPSALPERAREIEFTANDTEAKIIICQGDEVDQVLKALPSLKTVEHVISVPESRDDKLLDYRKLLDASGTDLVAYPTSPTDAASIFYTGGTTGHPKGCIHSHATEVIVADMVCGPSRAPTSKDVFLVLAPLGHAFGNGEKINFPFRFGAAVVYKERPSSAESWELIEKYQVTILAGAPTSYRLMLDFLEVDRRGKWSLRFVVASGEMMNKDLGDNWFKKTGVEIHNSVGMT
ncbi:MAG: AMP-binding protein, partial [Desulfitobacteriaceae bacterium]